MDLDGTEKTRDSDLDFTSESRKVYYARRPPKRVCNDWERLAKRKARDTFSWKNYRKTQYKTVEHA